MAATGKKRTAAESVVENRVWLFESLAKTLIAARAADLVSKDASVRGQVIRALAELAAVSCEVADSAALSPEELRARIDAIPRK